MVTVTITVCISTTVYFQSPPILPDWKLQVYYIYIEAVERIPVDVKVVIDRQVYYLYLQWLNK